MGTEQPKPHSTLLGEKGAPVAGHQGRVPRLRGRGSPSGYWMRWPVLPAVPRLALPAKAHPRAIKERPVIQTVLRADAEYIYAMRRTTETRAHGSETDGPRARWLGKTLVDHGCPKRIIKR